MFKRLFFKKPKVVGVTVNCPQCDTSFHKGKRIGEKQFKRRTEIYVECSECGCQYKYHFGI